MAKIAPVPVVVASTYTPADILTMDYEQLMAVGKPLIDAVNKRLKRLAKSGKAQASQSYQSLGSKTFRVERGKESRNVSVVKGTKKEGYKISYAPMPSFSKKANEEILRQKVATAYKLMFQTPSASVSGVNKIYKQVEQTLGIHFTNKQQANAFWNMYHDMQDFLAGSNDLWKQLVGTNKEMAKDAFDIYKESQGKTKKQRLENMIIKMHDLFPDKLPDVGPKIKADYEKRTGMTWERREELRDKIEKVNDEVEKDDAIFFGGNEEL